MEWLEGPDALFLYMETPSNPMHGVFTGVFEPAAGPGRERVRRLLEQRLHRMPRLRQRVVEVPFGLHHPAVIDDADFDLDYHVRTSELPPPGGERELAAFVADVAGRPLDRGRPLWEIHIVGGLEGGRWAVVAKAHHAIVDGVGGNELMVNLLDLSARPRKVSPPVEEWAAERPPSDLALLAGGLRSTLSSPVRLVGAARRSTGRVWELLRRGGDEEGHAVPLTLGPRTMLNRPIGLQRQAAFTDLPLAQVQSVKRALDSTVNDVVLAIVGRALRRFLVAHGDEPEGQLVAAVPISTRTHDDAGPGNSMSGMTVPLADDVDDPVDQVRRIQQATAAAKDFWGAIGAEVLRDWTQFAAPAVAAQAFRFYSASRLSARHRPLANLLISNLPGPDSPLYLAGSRLESMYPLGPVLPGQALNVTVASYQEHMHVGIVAARDALPPLDGLVDGLHAALEALGQAVRPRSRPARRAGG